MAELVGNLLVAQSGGPTSVINSSLAGVIQEAGRHDCIEEIYGGANGILGAGAPLACGAGLAAKYRKKGEVAVSFVGDGASNQGTFLESLNLAAVWNLPVIFVVENKLCVNKKMEKYRLRNKKNKRPLK